MTVPAALEESLGKEFQITRLLGKGSMGTVYLAREVALERLVAIKVPLPELATDPEVRARFVREARAAARISHPGAASVYRTGEMEDGTPFLIMQYIEGRTLEDVLAAEGPFPAERGLDIMEQVAAALAAAHVQGIIHRDLRPGNVIWNEATGKAIITDFGIAGILETGSQAVSRITRAGQRLGEVGFVSPEQLQGETLTEAADVYSLGVLAHHLLTGEGPFSGKTPAQLIRSHLQDQPRPISERTPGVPSGAADLLDRCLNKTAAQRPSADRVRAALEAARTGEGTGGGGSISADAHDPDSAMPLALREFIRQVRRRKVGGAALGYLAVAFIVVQVADGISLPGVTDEALKRTVTGLVVAGFPLALVASWLYDLSGKGITRTEGDPETAGSRGAQIAIQVVAIVLSLVLAGSLAWWFVWS